MYWLVIFILIILTLSDHWFHHIVEAQSQGLLRQLTQEQSAFVHAMYPFMFKYIDDIVTRIKPSSQGWQLEPPSGCWLTSTAKRMGLTSLNVGFGITGSSPKTWKGL